MVNRVISETVGIVDFYQVKRELLHLCRMPSGDEIGTNRLLLFLGNKGGNKVEALSILR